MTCSQVYTVLVMVNLEKSHKFETLPSDICTQHRFTSACAESSLDKDWSDHYENMPIQIYWKFYHPKMKILQIKNSDIFHISAQNIDWGYSLEPPQRGGSNEYPQSMFRAEIRKIMYTPVNLSFTI